MSDFVLKLISTIQSDNEELNDKTLFFHWTYGIGLITEPNVWGDTPDNAVHVTKCVVYSI